MQPLSLSHLRRRVGAPRFVAAVALVLLPILASAPGRAQELSVDSLAFGKRVRYATRTASAVEPSGAAFGSAPGSPAIAGAWRVGKIVDRTTDSLRLAIGHDTQTVALADLDRLQLSEGRHSSAGHFLIGGVLGALLGASIGSAVGSSHDCGSGGLCFQELAAAQDALIGAGLGFLVGGVIGASVPGERWAPVSLEPRAAATRAWHPMVAVRPRSRSVALAFRIAR